MGTVKMVSQQQLQQQFSYLYSNVGINNQNAMQRQSNQVLYASNILSNQAKVVQSNKVARRALVQQNNIRNMNNQIQPLIINNDLMQEQTQINSMDNNSGNNMSIVQQIAAAEMPALPIGNGKSDLHLNVEINLPKINLNKRLTKSNVSSNSSKHQLIQLKKSFIKINRKLNTRLRSNKKLKNKVDNCFKW